MAYMLCKQDYSVEFLKSCGYSMAATAVSSGR